MTWFRWSWLVVPAVVASPALAGPKAPQCVPGDTSNMTMHASGGKAIACWSADGDCLSLDDGKVVARPPADTPATGVRDDGGKLSACNATTCKPLGGKLAARVGEARKLLADAASASSPHLDVGVTPDLALVAIDLWTGGDHDIVELWNVAHDKSLALKRPAVFPKDSTATLARVDVAGGLALASWSEGGPLATGKVIAVEHDGSNRSKAVDAGDYIALGNGFVAVVGAHAVTALDTSGRHAGQVALDMGIGPDGSWPSGVAVAADELVVVSAYMPTDDPRSVVHVKLAKTGKPTIASKATIPICKE